jgi:hypothetical protein
VQLNAFTSRSEKEVQMNTLRKKLTAISVAGTVGIGLLALPTVPASAAPVAPNQNAVKQAAPQQNEDVQWRRRRGRWIGPAIALGVIGGAIAAHQYHRGYYYDPYYPAYYAPPPAYYYGYGPRYRYYGW